MTTAETPIYAWSATEIAAAVSGGRVGAREVLEAHLARLEVVNPGVNAITQVFRERAIAAAKRVDEAVAAGHAVGPLAGVPFSVKEHIGVAGAATTMGVAALRDARASGDAPAIERLCAAGAIPLGSANLPDLSLRVHTRSQLYGDTRNPWDPAMSPGGSSGGDGVAVATGMVAFGIGSDAGGSLRLPALFGGVAALKPSAGRIPDLPAVGPVDVTLASQLIPVLGPIARSIADLRGLFAALAGPDPRDPRVVPAPLEGPPRKGAIRVGVLRDPGGPSVAPAVRRALERAALTLRDAGLPVEEVEAPRLSEIVEAYGRMIMTEMKDSWPMLSRLLSEDSRAYLELAMARAAPATLDAYLALTATRQGLVRDWARLLDEVPILLGPVFTEAAMPVGFDVAGEAEHAQVGAALRLCSATSFLGLPAVAVPVGLEEGLPQGVQVVGPWFREDLCLYAAELIESRVGRLGPVDPKPSPSGQR